MPKWIWATWCHQNPGNRVNFKDQCLTHIILLLDKGDFYTFNKIQKSHSGTAKITLWMPCQSEYGPPGSTKTLGTGSFSKISTQHTLYIYKVKFTSIIFINFKKVILARLKWHFECHAKVNMGQLVSPKPRQQGQFQRSVPDPHYITYYRLKVTCILLIKFKKVILARLK